CSRALRPVLRTNLRADRLLRIGARYGTHGLRERPKVPFRIEHAIRARAVELILGLLHDDAARLAGSVAVRVDIPIELDVERLRIEACGLRAARPFAPFAADYHAAAAAEAHLGVQHVLVVG